MDTRREGSLIPHRHVATRPQQTAVDADEMAMLINGGWRFIQELFNGVVIVEEQHIPPYDDSMAA